MPRPPVEPTDFSDQPPARRFAKPNKPNYGLWIGLGIAAALLVMLMCGGVVAVLAVALLSAQPTAVYAPAPQPAELAVADDLPPSEMPLKTFLATRPNEAVLFRLKGKLSDHYNWAYRGTSDRFWSVHLVDTETFASATGFIAKDSPDGKQLFELLKDGREHRLSLYLIASGPNGEHLGPERNGDCVGIFKVAKAH